ncbi:MAG TPA: VWA domain-containing protein, partial [Verrucomicrobiae bacterium]|nr:VWA domain-containing protein [Verrucomicrobiae bacterium]
MQDLDYRIVNFVHLLRILGIRASVAETLDAIKGLTFADLSNRSQVKAVLRATLLKNMDQLPLFEEGFASYFSLPELQQGRRAKRQEEEAVLVGELARAEEELNFQGQPLELTVEQKQLYNKLPEEGKQRIQGFLQRSSEGQKYGEKLDVNFKPIIENLVRGHLDYWKRQLGEDRPLFDVIPTGDDEVDDLIRDVAENLRDHQGNYLYEDLKNIEDKDLPKVNLLIRKLSRRLASRISRRYRSSKGRERLDLRRSIRSSLNYGGVLVELKYKARPKHKPQFLLLCDVSGSMARYAGFVLQFIYGLSSVLKGIESFVFSEDLEHLSHGIARNHDFAG